jgi:hypothetical protein
MRRYDAGVPGVGRLRAVLGDERHKVHREHAGLLHHHGHLRHLDIKRAVRNDDAGVQHHDAPLPCLRQRR